MEPELKSGHLVGADGPGSNGLVKAVVGLSVQTKCCDGRLWLSDLDTIDD